MQDLFLVNEYFTSKYYHFYIEKKRKAGKEKKSRDRPLLLFVELYSERRLGGMLHGQPKA